MVHFSEYSGRVEGIYLPSALLSALLLRLQSDG